MEGEEGVERCMHAAAVCGETSPSWFQGSALAFLSCGLLDLW
jgi:hypothetical protein